MGHFPFFVEIGGKRGVIVGGGRVAARKVEKLLPFGPVLTVIAPRIEDCMRTLEKRPREQEHGAASLLLEERAFALEDLAGADFVIAATDEEAVNRRIAEYCQMARIPVNVVDDREKCTFFFPALVKEGALTVGISTDGKSPVAAAWVRRKITGTLPYGLGDTIDLMGQIRPLVMERVPQEDDRKRILEKLFLYCLEKEGKAAVAKTVFGTKETLILIRAKDGQMLLNTLFFEEEIAVNPAKQIDLKGTAAEMKMATTIIEGMTDKFDPSEYKDEYREKVMDAIEKKIAGKEIVSPKEKSGATITDLMEALTKSLEMTKSTKPTAKTASLSRSRNIKRNTERKKA